MSNLIDFTECDDVFDVMIDESNDKIDVWIDDSQYIYDLVRDNYDTIIQNKELYDIVKPTSNSVTRRFLDQGYDETEAITLSIWSIMYLCKKLIY